MALTETQLNNLVREIIVIYPLIRDAMLDPGFAAWLATQSSKSLVENFSEAVKLRLSICQDEYRDLIENMLIHEHAEIKSKKWKKFLIEYKAVAEYLSVNVFKLRDISTCWYIHKLPAERAAKASGEGGLFRTYDVGRRRSTAFDAGRVIGGDREAMEAYSKHARA